MKKDNSKFIVVVVLAIGFLVVGYLYALGNRYEPMANNNTAFLDTWTGKIYLYDGRKMGEIEE